MKTLRRRDQECPRGSPEPDRRSIAWISRSRTARSLGSHPKFRPKTRTRFSMPKIVGVSGLRRRAHAYRHLRAAGAGRGVGEQGRRHGRRHLKSELHPYRYIIISTAAAHIANSCPKCASSRKGNFWVDYGFHLAPIEGRPHRRDGISRSRTRRSVVQDFHVLRRLWVARSIVASRTTSHDRAGGTLRHRAFRVHHAFGALRSWRSIPKRPTISA